MLWQSSKAHPILSETTDCIQPTDYLYTKPVPPTSRRAGRIAILITEILFAAAFLINTPTN
jgi:hypothetical protein